AGQMLVFFFQAEDGIRDFHVTGVQTCALPISQAKCVALALEVLVNSAKALLMKSVSGCTEKPARTGSGLPTMAVAVALHPLASKIGRASCREREDRPEVAEQRNRATRSSEAWQ